MCCSYTVLFFFFKQKTAYEIQGDWSSDVCSSDLLALVAAELLRMVASWPWWVAESTRPSVPCRLVAALASTSDPWRRFDPTDPITSACSFVTFASRSAIWPKSLIEHRSSFTASESNAVWMRLETVAMSVAMRLALAVSWPLARSVAPGHLPPPPARAATSARRTLGSLGGGSREISVAAHSPNSDAEAATTAGAAGGGPPPENF